MMRRLRALFCRLAGHKWVACRSLLAPGARREVPARACVRCLEWQLISREQFEQQFGVPFQVHPTTTTNPNAERS